MLSCNRGAHGGTCGWDQRQLSVGALEGPVHPLAVPRPWGLAGAWTHTAWPGLSCSTVSPFGPACSSLGCALRVRAGPPQALHHRHSSLRPGGAPPARVWEEHFPGVLWRSWRCWAPSLRPAIHEGGASHSQLDTRRGGRWGWGHGPSLLLPSLPAVEMGV